METQTCEASVVPEGIISTVHGGGAFIPNARMGGC